MSAEVICEKSFSDADGEIVDCFVEFQNALIDGNLDALKSVLSDDFQLMGMFGENRSREDLISKVSEKILDFSKSDIVEPTILFDDEDTASLIGDVRLTAKINGNERRWISKTVVSFRKADGKWVVTGWQN